MGNEVSASALHDLVKLEKARRGASSTLVKPDLEQKLFVWDPLDCSPNMNVNSRDPSMVERKKDHSHTDAVRCKTGFEKGIHIWEIDWPPEQRGEHSCVGLAMSATPLTVDGSCALIGSEENTIAWDLGQKKLYFSGQEVSEYPRDRLIDLAEFKVIVVIADLESRPATLSFKVGDHDLGPALKGLEFLEGPLFPAVSTTGPAASIGINYLGGTETIAGWERGIASSLSFHAQCSTNIVLENQNHTATRSSGERGVVFSCRDLKYSEMFEIKIEEINDASKSSMTIGLTSNSPTDIRSSLRPGDWKKGTSWWFEGETIYRCVDGDKAMLRSVNVNLSEVKVGDRVGLRMTEDGNLMVYSGGVCLIRIPVHPAKQHWGVVVLGARVKKISIIDPDYRTTDDRHTASGATALSPDDPRAILEGLKKTLEQLREKELVKLVTENVHKYINRQYHSLTNRRHQEFLGNVIAELDGAKAMTEYLRMLESADLSRKDVWVCYSVITSSLWNYTDVSVLLAKELVKAGFLEICVKTLQNIHSSYKSNESKQEKLLSTLGILHNCSKVPDNQATYRRLGVAKCAAKYTDGESHPPDVILPALFIISYVYTKEEIKLMKIPPNTLSCLLQHIESALDASRHRYNGWSALELMQGLANLGILSENRKSLVNNGGAQLMLRMLREGDSSEQEVALNAIWEYTDTCTRDQLAKTPGLKEEVQKLKQSKQESLSQAASRVLHKLTITRTVTATTVGKVDFRKECPQWKLCTKFKDSLKLHEGLFDPRFDMCFCASCHSKRGDKAFYERGNPAKRYGLPVGWCRFALKVDARAESLKAYDNWHRAFHGTRADSVESILQTGSLCEPGTTLLGGRKLRVCDGHFTDEKKPKDFDIYQVFLSPSIRYAGCDVYAKKSQFVHDQKTYAVRVAFQVFISPKSYKVGPETIGAGRRQVDPSFSNQELEWSTRERGSTILYGLMVKLEEPGLIADYLR